MVRVAAKDVVEVLSDDCFRAVRSAADSGLLLCEDLDNYKLPEGYTADEVWQIVTAVRKQAAILIPEDSYRTVDCWFVTTTAMSLDSKMLEMRCMTGSYMDRALNVLKGSPFVTRFIERTLSRVLETENVRVSDERIHEIFTGEPVQNDLDRVISNYFKLSSEIEAFAKREITHGLIETLYYRLIEDVNLDNIPCRGEVRKLDPRLEPSSSEDCIDAVCRRARLDYDEESRFGCILRIINVSWFFWNFDIFPCLNSLVGVLLRNVLAIKWGYPVLSWLPVGYYPFGELNTSRMEEVFNSWCIDYGFGFDFTSYFSVYIELYLEELNRLEASLRQLQRINELITLTFGTDLNDRQKSILSTLCREPHAVLRISTHQRTFRVAYATARSDFLDLVRRGYLEKGQVGKAFVFRACSELREKIVNLGEVVLGRG